MQSQQPTEDFQGQVLTELRAINQRLDIELKSINSRLGTLEKEQRESNQKLTEEVKRWDERFFKFAEDSSNRANSLIAGATISVIAGVVLLLLRS